MMVKRGGVGRMKRGDRRRIKREVGSKSRVKSGWQEDEEEDRRIKMGVMRRMRRGTGRGG